MFKSFKRSMKINVLISLSLLILCCLPVNAQEKVDSLLLDESLREVKDINNSVLNRAYIYKNKTFGTLIGDKIYSSTAIDNLPQVYFDREGRVRKLVQSGMSGDIYISYFDKDGYLRYMVSKGLQDFGNLSSIIFAKKNNIIYANFQGYGEEVGEFTHYQYEGNIPDTINGLEVGAFSHVDSIKTRFNVSLQPPVDTQRVSFELIPDDLPIYLNRGEIPEPRERKEPSSWQLKHFGRQKNFIPDTYKLEQCRLLVKGINEMPLVKLYPSDNPDSAQTWQVFTGDTISTGISDTEDSHSLYVDANGKLRKYIRNLYKNEENTSSIYAYYDDSGNLLRMLYNHRLYDTIYTVTERGREVYDTNYAHVYGSINLLKGELIEQTYNRIDFYNNFQPTRYAGTGKSLLSRVGLLDLSPFLHAGSVLSHLNINLSDYDLGSGTNICFKGNIVNSLTMINAERIPVMAAPVLNSRVLLTVDAGLNAYVREKLYEQFVEGYGTNNWCKITFCNSINYKSGYIYGGYLEPGESIYVKKRRVRPWRQSSY